MERLAVPKNMNAQAASLIAKRISSKQSGGLLFNSKTVPRRSAQMSPIKMIDFESLEPREKDSDDDKDLSPMTRIAKKVIRIVYI